MRDDIQRNASQAHPHKDWFHQQVEDTRAGITKDEQATLAGNEVHEWLDSWGSDTEKPVSPPRPRRQKQG